MNICFISHKSDLGGAERVLLECCSILKSTGHRVYCMMHKYGPLRGELDKLEIPNSIIPFKSWMSGTRKAFLYKKQRGVRRLIRNLMLLPFAVHKLGKWKCELIISNTCTIYFGLLCAKFLKIPHIQYIHEYGKLDHGLDFDWGANFSKKLMMEWSSLVLFNNQTVLEYFTSNKTCSNVTVLEPYVDVPSDAVLDYKELPDIEAGLRVLMLGQIRKSKGQKDGIEAAIKLHTNGIPIELNIVGSERGEYKRELEKEIEKYDVGLNIKFHGWKKNIYSYFGNSNVVLVCSRNEAFGRVTVEAMKVGVPVVGANSGGTRAIIRDGETGLLYNPGDVQALIDCLKRLYREKDLHYRLSTTAKRYATIRFSKERFANELVSAVSKATQFV